MKKSHSDKLTIADDGVRNKVSSLDQLDNFDLPPAQDGHRPETIEAVAETAIARLRDGNEVFDNGRELGSLVNDSWAAAKDILKRTAGTNDPKMLSIRKDMVASIWNFAAKVDEGQLRRKQTDLLPKLLAIMAKEEAKLPVVIDG